MFECTCYFCKNGKEHPGSHVVWEDDNPVLLKSNSLRKEDIVLMEFCSTCGHSRRKEE